MKKSVISSIWSLLVPALLFSCAEDAQEGNRIPIHFNASTSNGLIQTRAAVGDTWIGDGTEKVAISIDGVVKKYKVTNTSGTLEPEVTNDYFFWPHNNSTLMVSAWYPYADTKPAVTVMADQSGADYESSYLMEASTASPVSYNNDVELDFIHRTAKLTIVPKDNNGVDFPSNVGATLTLMNIQGLDAGTTLTPHANSDGCSYSAFIAPQQLTAANNFVKIIFGSKEYIYTLDAAGAQNLEAGKSYTFNIKFAAIKGIASASSTPSENTSTLTYTGTALNLMGNDTKGSSENGTIYYRMKDPSGNFSAWTTNYADIVGTNAGDYTVYYYIKGDEYYTDNGSEDSPAGSFTVNIAKAAGSISYAKTFIPKKDTDAAFINALTKTGDGSVTYSSSMPSVATVNSSGQVAIQGTRTTIITATVADGANYTYANKTATYTLKVWNQGNAPAACQAVDLGLPSGILWANMNVGATTIKQYGNLYQWAGTSKVDNAVCYWNTCPYNGGSMQPNNFSKYNESDGKTILESTDDAATVNWRGNWRMPTKEEFEELLNTYSTDGSKGWTWTWYATGNSTYSIGGYEIRNNTSGNSIFLPAGGSRYIQTLYYRGDCGYYLSSSLRNTNGAVWGLQWGDGEDLPHMNNTNMGRCEGDAVRAVQ